MLIEVRQNHPKATWRERGSEAVRGATVRERIRTIFQKLIRQVDSTTLTSNRIQRSRVAFKRHRNGVKRRTRRGKDEGRCVDKDTLMKRKENILKDYEQRDARKKRRIKRTKENPKESKAHAGRWKLHVGRWKLQAA